MPTIVAEDNETKIKSFVSPKRPKWEDVYNGYPKVNIKGTTLEDDQPAEEIFKVILGDNYDRDKFSNACATRISIALNKAQMVVKKDFLIQQGDLKGKGFIASAKGLQQWLSTIWGSADIEIKGKSTLLDVAKKINGKNGVYIILGGFGDGITGHATLWIGTNNDVIGGHNYIDYGGTVYFWELK